jgi:probable biosynthetic protein (TIGR04098 family)
MRLTRSFIAGLPQLDIHTLSEDWALGAALEGHWALLAESLGLRPSQWFDTQGERMYGAVIALRTRFDLADVIREDDVVTVETAITSIRKPHSLSLTRFLVNGVSKAEVSLLTSFIKRNQQGSNKKFSKVRDLWTAEDFDGSLVDALLETHHLAKSEAITGTPAMQHEVNRIADFNTADFLYFKNFVRISKAAEWRQNRAQPTRLNRERDCFYFGNVDDGDIIEAHVGRDGDAVQTWLVAEDGRRLFLSRAVAPQVTIVQR